MKRMSSTYEVEDFLEEENGPYAKKSRSSIDQLGAWNNGCTAPQPQYNPLDEPNPLGLRLRKTPSLVHLLEMKLSQEYDSPVAAAPSRIRNFEGNEDAKITNTVGASDKPKATNFSASILKIGSWEYVSRYEGDLVVKCYFAKHKLVWEVLQNGLKRKFEIQWSHIMAIRANCPDDGPGTLTIVLVRQPLFFKETNPQPRKHTLWQACGDFTGGQARRYREHFLQCPSGSLKKNYEKMVQSDMHLNRLSQQPKIMLDSPYFETQTSEFENAHEAKIPGHTECSSSSGSTASGTSSLSEYLPLPRVHNCVSKGAPSPSSVMDAGAIEGNGNFVVCNSNSAESGEQSEELLQIPGMRPSMSMSDLVNHMEDQITEQIASRNMPSEKAMEWQNMLENVEQSLLSDAPNTANSDEKSLMKKVNSLRCLLPDPPTSNLQTQVGEVHVEEVSKANQWGTGHDFSYPTSTTEHDFTNILAPPMSRNDSFADLLLQLPRIASLPRIFFDVDSFSTS